MHWAVLALLLLGLLLPSVWLSMEVPRSLSLCHQRDHQEKKVEDCAAAVKWLEKVSQISNHTFVLEEVLLNRLSQYSCKEHSHINISEVLFVIMCSHDLQGRAKAISESWLQWVPRSLLIADQQIAGVNVTIIPTGQHHRKLHVNHTNYVAANILQLKSMKWLVARPSEMMGVKWIFLVDDDTFINVPFLVSFLRRLPHSLPVLLGFMFNDPEWEPIKNISWPSGGAGMLMSRVAFERLAALLFTPECQVIRNYNDMTLGLCSSKARVAKVHSGKFYPEPSWMQPFRYTRDVFDAGMVLTLHRVNPASQMTHTCLVSKRFEWQHPACNSTQVTCNPVCYA